MNKLKMLFITILTMCIFLVSNTAYASTQYTDVLDDLRKDESFEISNYSNMTLDYINKVNTDTDKTNDQELMEVISIAESSADELYIYVYQPTHNELDLIATAISLSTDYSADGQNIYPNVYDLELVSTYSVFDKYVVKDFKVNDEVYRYYNLVALYREYNSTIDKVVSGGESTGSEIAMSIGQQWSVYYLNDKLVYEMGTFETLEITPTFTGNFEFQNGLTWGSLVGSFNRGQAWFISFNVEDYIVKHIYDADLSYKIREMSYSTGVLIDPIPTYFPYGSNYDDNQAINKDDTDYETGGFSEFKITLDDEDEMTYKGDGLLAKEYSWNRITSSTDFLERATEQGVTISDECKQAVSQGQWVFSFLETESNTISGSTSTYYKYDIEDITILRLHFIDIHDDVYNMGVVSDRVNPDNKADGTGSGLDFNFEENFQKLFAIIMLVILLIVLGYIFPIASIIIKIFSVIINAIYFVISLPFKLIGKLFKQKNKNKPY